MKQLRTPARKRARKIVQTGTTSLVKNTSLVKDAVHKLPWLYFFSGVPALIYQTIWQRLLVLHSGVGASSIAIIVAAYLFGMGVGSCIGGWLSRRLTPRQALATFALIEFSIGVYAVASPVILYDILYLQFGWLYDRTWLICFLHVAALLFPTALMGSTLPLMTRAFVRDGGATSSSVVILYSLNTLGASVGAAIAPWFLMPYFGIGGAVAIGACCNFSIALVGLMLRKQIVDDNSQSASTETSALNTSQNVPPFWLWTVLYFLSGGCAIGLEIVWFRMLDVAVKSTSFTFGTLLSIYLLCMVMGSLAGIRLIKRVKVPFRVFLYLQCLVLVTAQVPIMLIMHYPAQWWPASWLTAYWSESEPFFPSFDQFSKSFALYGLLPIWLFGPSTFCMGLSFSVLQLGIQCNARTTSYRVGWLQSANIAGCTLGSLLVGLVLLNFVGTANTLQVLVVLGAVFALIGAVFTQQRWSFLAGTAGIIAFSQFLPNNNQLWLRLHGQPPIHQALVVEDVTGVVAFTPTPNGSLWRLSTNGKAQSRIPYGGVHSKLGALPVTLHPLPRRVAIIGLGSGNTAWAAACRSEIEELTVFEIFTSEQLLLRQVNLQKKWDQLEQFLSDTRVTISGRDARHALMTSDKQYDVIEADAIRPNGSYAGYLYSIEFFQLCSKRLRPGGYMCSWSPTPGTYITFCNAFSHVLELDGGSTLIGSNDPIDFDQSVWKARLESTAISRYLGAEVVADCLGCIDRYVMISPDLAGKSINTDLFPFDEFRSHK